jgi:hypothetical protein
LARQEIAIKRVVILAEEQALAPGAPEGRWKAGDDESGDAGHSDPRATCCEESGLIGVE